MIQYEEFNENKFEAYCKKCIDNAVLKERQRKAVMGKTELSFSDLTDSLLQTLLAEDDLSDHVEEEYQIFQVHGMSFYIYNQKLSWALSYLLPKDREIVLLYFFGGMKDKDIALLVKKSRATVSRRRRTAMEQLREFWEDAT